MTEAFVLRRNSRKTTTRRDNTSATRLPERTGKKIRRARNRRIRTAKRSGGGGGGGPTVDSSIGLLSDNLTEVIESRLGSFAQRFSEENGATVQQAVKKARRVNYTCKRKGDQQQLDHKLEVLDKFDAATSVLKNKSYDKVKAALEEGTGIVSKRIKAIK